MVEKISWYYACESLLGIGGIYPLLVRLTKLESPSPLEKKIKSILYWILLLFLVRIPYEAMDNQFSARLTFAVAPALALITFLYFETMFRRHMPFFLKVFVVALSVGFMFDSLFLDLIHKESHQVAFGIFVFIIDVAIVTVGVLRNKKDYTPSENTLINLSLLSLLVLGLFFLTDLRIVLLKFQFPRLGVLGALLFTYSSFHDQTVISGQSTFIKKLLKSGAFSFFLVVVLSTLVQNFDRLFLMQSFIFFMIINLFLRIHYVARSLDANDNFFSFVNSVVEANKSDLKEFLSEVKVFFRDYEIKLLPKSDLKIYDEEKLHHFFEQSGTHLFNLSDLRQMAQEKNDYGSEELETIEKLIDILEKFEMSHICHLGEAYVVFNHHAPGQSNVVFTQTALLKEFAKLINPKN